MKIYKKLAGQTIVYGMGTIVPKILNYVILTAYYTRLFPPEKFGVVTELYAYVIFLMIILTYGTETGFFRFAQKDNSDTVFGSLVVSLFTTSIVFVFAIILLSNKIAEVLYYVGNERYIIILALIVGIDAFSTILFAKLRKEERSKKFAILKIVNVIVTILAVLLFYEFLPTHAGKVGLNPEAFQTKDVVYVFYSNLIASFVVLICLLPELFSQKIKFDYAVLKSVLAYSFPLLIAGLAGTINEALDRVLLKHLITDTNEALYVLGIYGANYRIAMLLSIFVQMFRYAVEPFYFNYYGKKDEKEVFATIMRLFIGVMIVLCMIIMFYLKYIKFFIPVEYHEGLRIIPIVLIAFVFYGIFFNQSVWYKLTKKTGYAILLTLIGALITIIANVFFVRKYSYLAAAYGHFFAYFIMMLVSYFVGRKFYKINYKLGRILEYFVVAIAIFVFRIKLIPDNGVLYDILSGIIIILFAGYILFREKLTKAIQEKIWK